MHCAFNLSYVLLCSLVVASCVELQIFCSSFDCQNNNVSEFVLNAILVTWWCSRYIKLVLYAPYTLVLLVGSQMNFHFDLVTTRVQ